MVFNKTKQEKFEKLSGVVHTASVLIEHDTLQQLANKHRRKDEILRSDENPLYYTLHRKLRQIQTENQLNTPVYIFQKVVRDGAIHFQFLVTSAIKPYFRHEYHSYPQIVVDSFETGGTFGPYRDEHGIWLSSFAPIKNPDGTVIGIVQADTRIADFFHQAWNSMKYDLLIFVMLFAGGRSFCLPKSAQDHARR